MFYALPAVGLRGPLRGGSNYVMGTANLAKVTWLNSPQPHISAACYSGVQHSKRNLMQVGLTTIRPKLLLGRPGRDCTRHVERGAVCVEIFPPYTTWINHTLSESVLPGCLAHTPACPYMVRAARS